MNLIGHAQVSLPTGMPDASELILWLSPDSGVYRNSSNIAAVGNRVRIWRDLSGNGFDFKSTANTFRPKLVKVGGFNYLDFTGGDFLENIAIKDSINGLTEFSMFVVIKSDLTNTDNGFLDSETPNGTDDKVCLRYDLSGANTGRNNLIKSGLGGNFSSHQVETVSNTQTTDRQVLTITWSINSELKVYIDGTLNEVSASTINTPLSSIQKIVLGKGPKNTSSNSGWNGKIGSVIFYKREFPGDTISVISQTIQTIYSVKTGNWNNNSTWQCNCIPTDKSDVEIRPGHTVTIDNNAEAANLFIGSGSILQESSLLNPTMMLKGDLVNQGSYVANEATFMLNGNGEQRLVGTSTFHNLTLDNSAGAKVEGGNISIHGTLSLVDGNFDTDDQLTILSNATRTGRIGEITGGSISGDVLVQRFINAGSTNWRNLSSPIQNASLASWNDDFITSGFTGSDFPFFPFTSIYSYNETVLGSKRNGYEPASNVANPIGVGEGFMVWCGDTITGTQPFTIDVVGPVNTGTINLPVTYTDDPTQPASEDGWNLIGNPYASTIDWDASGWTKSGVNDAIYIWDPDAEQYASYVNGTGTNGGSRYIASSQAFWVQTNSNPTLTITESAKADQNDNFLRMAAAKIDQINVKIDGNGFKDETVIRFDEMASDSFDTGFDARKIYSSSYYAPSILSVLDTNEYAISTLPYPTENKQIPLKVKVKRTGTYAIQLSPKLRGQKLGCIIFEDQKLNVSFIVDKDTTYTCTISNSLNYNRFRLVFGVAPEKVVQQVQCHGDTNGSIRIAGQGDGPWNYSWIDEKGMVLKTSSGLTTADSISNLGAGTYTILVANSGVCGDVSQTIELTNPLPITAAFNIEKLTNYQNETVKFDNQSNNALAYEWQFGDSSFSVLEQPEHIYDETGKYDVTLIATGLNKCADTIQKVINIVPSYTAIKEVEEAQEMTTELYPNPANEVFNINTTGLEKGFYSLIIFSTSGVVVIDEKTFIENGQQQVQINSQHLVAGFYQLVLEGPSGKFVNKLMINH